MKVAIFVLSELGSYPDRGRVVNALETAKEFRDASDEVELIFDGAGTISAVTMAQPEHRLYPLFAQVKENVSNVCRHCAQAFDVFAEAEELGLPIMVEHSHQHPSIRQRILDGYQVLTF